jgi:hypothetical protein
LVRAWSAAADAHLVSLDSVSLFLSLIGAPLVLVVAAWLSREL